MRTDLKAKDFISRLKEKEMLNERKAGRKAAAYLTCVMLVAIWAIVQPQAVHAQWSTSGNDINSSNTGNVGVGTPGPDRKVDIMDTANPQLRLTFTDASVFTDLQTLSSGQFIINPTGMDVVSTKPLSIGTTSDAFRFYTTADSNLRWAITTDSTGLFNIAQKGNGWADQGTRFTINRSGNVGIGTTAPVGRFEIVNSSGAFTASNYFQITGSTANNSNLPGISLKGGTLAAEYPFLQLGNNGLSLTVAGGRNSGTSYPNRMQLILSSNTTGTGAAAFQVFNGTTTQDLFTVKDNGLVGVNIAPVSGYRFYVTEQTANSYAGAFRHNQGSTGSRGIYVETNGNNAADDVIGAYSAGGTNPVFVARANGNVGVGTSSPSQKLEVSGNIKLTGTGNGIVFPDGTVQSTAATGSGNPQWTPSGANIYYNTGNVGIGAAPNTAYKLDVAGDLNASGAITGGTINARYQDVAEWVPSSQKLSAGTVVILDPEKSNQVIASSESYDTRVAGVVSDSPGVILGEGGEGKVKVATTGRVKVKVDASRGPIRIGDLLVTSDRQGTAMKSVPVNLQGRMIHSPGTIIGKALEPLENGTGEILVLLSLQ
jgi:hypothetical protein